MRVLGAVLAGWLALGCTLTRPLDDLEGGSAPTTAAECVRDSDCARGRCVESEGRCRDCPPEMRLGRFGDTAFCIDQYEATQAEYARFLRETGGVPGVSAERVCDVNLRLEPATDGPGCAEAFDPERTPDRPVVCVDACDAHSYCEHGGKRICGTNGGGAPDDDDESSYNEWRRTCTDGNRDRHYPYGDAFIEGRCNVNSDGPADVGSFLECKTANEVYDLSGNVAEWAGCTTSGNSATCTVRGGSFRHSEPTQVACQVPRVMPAEGALNARQRAMVRLPTVGFRCCSD